MTPSALYHGARMAIRTARQCERDATCHDRDWHVKKLTAARECREMAAYYLERRRWMLNDMKEPR